MLSNNFEITDLSKLKFILGILVFCNCMNVKINKIDETSFKQIFSISHTRRRFELSIKTYLETDMDIHEIK